MEHVLSFQLLMAIIQERRFEVRIMTLNSKTILLIEDDVDFVNFIKLILEREGAKIIHVNHPRKILEAIITSPPDLVLLDLNFYFEDEKGETKLDRGEFVLKLRQGHEYLKNTPVIVCSSENITETISNVESIGANGFMAKPIPAKELVSNILNFLNKGI